MIEKIKNFYSGMRKMIKDKEQEHIDQVKEIKEKEKR